MHRPSYYARFLLRDLRAFVEREHLRDGEIPVLLAVSGGIDSTVLAHLFHTAGWPFALAHVNYQLRGAASNGDEAFVRSLAAAYDVPLHATTVDGGRFTSVQTEARTFRYAQFETWRTAQGYAAVATAHHADDAVETAVANFVRGTGISGLRGILPRRDAVIRPLLFARKSTLLAYAERHGLTYRTDASNAETHYTRNRIRHTLLPQLETLNPNFAERNLATQAHLRETEWLSRYATRTLLQQWLVRHEQHWELDVTPLRTHPAARTLLHAWLSPSGFNEDQTSQLARHLRTGSGGRFRSATHTVHVKSGKARLYANPDEKT